MAVAVIMPRQGQSVESCIITKWNKNEGDQVAVGDILFSYETDKAAFDEEAKTAGVMLKRFFAEGDDVPCLTNVCVIGSAGEDVSGFSPEGGESAAVESAPAEEVKAEEAKAEVVASGAAFEGKISPRARAMAEKSNVIVSRVAPTGPDGRVIARDVEKAIADGLVATSAAAKAGVPEGAQGTGIGGRVTIADLAPKAAEAAKVEAPKAEAPKAESVPAEGDTYDEPMTNIRKVIAKAMSASLANMAQLTHNLSFDCTEIQAMRKLFKEKGEAMGMEKITLNDIILYAVARTLIKSEHRALNANLIDGKTMRYYRHVNLGMAVDTERGLMVPTIVAADTLSLKELSAEAKKLAKACQTGTINPDLLKGGSFTVSNLGSLGIESFTPVVNPPQTGILGVNTIVTRVKEVNGELKAYPAMTLSLTYDHRALDGSPASRFLKDLKDNLENFTLLLAKG